MGIKIIKEREPKTDISFSINFDYKDSNGGFTFPSDKDGNILKEEMSDLAIENYYKCLNDDTLSRPYIRVHKNHWVEPAIGKCYCGNEVVLENQYLGACQCDKCGQWYNIYGQSLIPPEYWEEN